MYSPENSLLEIIFDPYYQQNYYNNCWILQFDFQFFVLFYTCRKDFFSIIVCQDLLLYDCYFSSVPTLTIKKNSDLFICVCQIKSFFHIYLLYFYRFCILLYIHFRFSIVDYLNKILFLNDLIRILQAHLNWQWLNFILW